jgi:hypothetical protein
MAMFVPYFQAFLWAVKVELQPEAKLLNCVSLSAYAQKTGELQGFQ